MERTGSLSHFVARAPALALAGLGVVLGACGPPATPDAGMDASCSLVVQIGPSDGGAFVPYGGGEEVPVILGFQGFQMLRLDVRVAGASAPASVDLSAYVRVEDTGVEASRMEREADTTPDGDAVLVEGFLLFFNDAPLSLIGGHDARVELIARAGGCVGGTSVVVHLSDMPPCIDPDASVPDAGVSEAGLPDGSVVCGAP